MDYDCYEITGDILIHELLQLDMGCAPILLVYGLDCFGCMVSTEETLSEACEHHGIDLEAILNDLNRYFNEGSLYE